MKEDILKIIDDIEPLKVRDPPSKCQRRILLLEKALADIRVLVDK